MQKTFYKNELILRENYKMCDNLSRPVQKYFNEEVRERAELGR